MSAAVTPSTSPKRSAVTSVAKASVRETMTTPRESIPTNSSPMPVSSRTRVRDDTTVTRPLITSAATRAPRIGLKPQSDGEGDPGDHPVGEGVAQEGQASQDDPGPDHRRGEHRHQPPDERPLHERRLEGIEDQVDHGEDAHQPRASAMREALVRTMSR